MSKKVTISVPDMLHEKLEQWRESFNLSKLFQDAVSDAIQKKEDFQRRIREDLDMGQIIERLKKEKLEAEGNYFEAGRNEGVFWAKSAYYEDLLYALQWKADRDIESDDVLGEYFSKIRKTSRPFASSTYQLEQHFLTYIAGWKQGVEQFWDEIRDKI